jgi:hypothetical protein
LTSLLSEFLLNTGSGSRVPSIFLLDVDYCGTAREKTYLHPREKEATVFEEDLNRQRVGTTGLFKHLVWPIFIGLGIPTVCLKTNSHET